MTTADATLGAASSSSQSAYTFSGDKLFACQLLASVLHEAEDRLEVASDGLAAVLSRVRDLHDGRLERMLESVVGVDLRVRSELGQLGERRKPERKAPLQSRELALVLGRCLALES